MLTVSAHDLAVAVGIETDLIAPVPRAQFEGRAAAIDGYIRQRLTVHGDDQVCPVDALAIDYARLPQDIVVRLAFRCPTAAEWLFISYLVFFDIDANHRGIGVIDTGAGREQFLFDPAITEIEVEVAAPPPPQPFLERATRFTVLGIEHIATGYDHLLFLIALLIVSARFLHLVKVVTAFTLAHSVTLSLAWFGFIDLPARARPRRRRHHPPVILQPRRRDRSARGGGGVLPAACLGLQPGLVRPRHASGIARHSRGGGILVRAAHLSRLSAAGDARALNTCAGRR